MNLCKKCTAKPYSFLVIDVTLTSDIYSRFRKNLFERVKKLITTIYARIVDEKMQYDIYIETAKISPISSGKVNK